MKTLIDNKALENFFEVVDDLSKLLDDRVIELHKVQGMQQCRHAYIFYRKLLWEARDIIKDNIEHIEAKEE